MVGTDSILCMAVPRYCVMEQDDLRSRALSLICLVLKYPIMNQ